jgi:hypothetical protein
MARAVYLAVICRSPGPYSSAPRAPVVSALEKCFPADVRQRQQQQLKSRRKLVRLSSSSSSTLTGRQWCEQSKRRRFTTSSIRKSFTPRCFLTHACQRTASQVEYRRLTTLTRHAVRRQPEKCQQQRRRKPARGRVGATQPRNR